MAEIATLTAVFTADLTQFEIGVARAISQMSSANGRISADLAGIAGASVGMSHTVIGAMHSISIAVQQVIAHINALKAAIASIPPLPSGGAGKSSTSNNEMTIQGGTFVFNGVQDVNSLYDALQEVSRQRSPL
jgi:hypothetical protein